MIGAVFQRCFKMYALLVRVSLMFLLLIWQLVMTTHANLQPQKITTLLQKKFTYP